MKYLKKREEFLNESLENISYDIDGSMESTIEGDWGMEIEEWVDMTADDFGIVKGFILYHSREFKLDGYDEKGDHIYVHQKGEYNMFGGPYDPKMEIPEIKINGLDVYPIVKQSFIDDGYLEGDNEIVASRSDLYPWQEINKFIGLTDDEREQWRKSYSGIKKYDL
jgi:hypothetical protein